MLYRNGNAYNVGYDQVVLVRKGFTPITIRNKRGYWEILEYTDRYGSERWVKIDELQFDVEEHIKKYGFNAGQASPEKPLV